jgi:hypothetical protein
MECVCCGSAAVRERPEHTAQGYRRLRCRTCGKQFNERSGGSLNWTQYPSDVIALVVLWRLRYRLHLGHRGVADPVGRRCLRHDRASTLKSRLDRRPLPYAAQSEAALSTGPQS